MVISADFEKQKQYFVKKIFALLQYRFIAISLYRNIGCKNCSSDKGLKDILLVSDKVPLVGGVLPLMFANEEEELD
jgi:hypothetical protein